MHKQRRCMQCVCPPLFLATPSTYRVSDAPRAQDSVDPSCTGVKWIKRIYLNSSPNISSFFLILHWFLWISKLRLRGKMRRSLQNVFEQSRGVRCGFQKLRLWQIVYAPTTGSLVPSLLASWLWGITRLIFSRVLFEKELFPRWLFYCPCLQPPSPPELPRPVFYNILGKIP